LGHLREQDLDPEGAAGSDPRSETLMSPPITPASRRLMVNPNPVPVCGCVTPSAPRSKGEDALQIARLDAGARYRSPRIPRPRCGRCTTNCTLPDCVNLMAFGIQVDQDLPQPALVA